jgi:hypothetical protein
MSIWPSAHAIAHCLDVGSAHCPKAIGGAGPEKRAGDSEGSRLVISGIVV